MYVHQKQESVMLSANQCIVERECGASVVSTQHRVDKQSVIFALTNQTLAISD